MRNQGSNAVGLVDGTLDAAVRGQIAADIRNAQERTLCDRTGHLPGVSGVAPILCRAIAWGSCEGVAVARGKISNKKPHGC